MRRPRRYHRGLLRAFYLSAMASLRTCTASQAYYGRKRNEGKGHKQALPALARRRANVLWAMLRDGEGYEILPTVTTASSHLERCPERNCLYEDSADVNTASVCSCAPTKEADQQEGHGD